LFYWNELRAAGFKLLFGLRIKIGYFFLAFAHTTNEKAGGG